jgi:hypothetical protein
MTPSLRRLASLALVALFAALPAAARADLAACQAAIQKATAAFERAETKALARCENGIRAGKLTDQDCRLEPKTLTALSKADAKRAKTIGKACGGADKACGGDLTGEFGGTALGYGAACPDLTGTDCENAIAADSCVGVDDCLACISRESVDLTIDVAFGDLAAPSGDKALDKCRAAIAKTGPLLQAARRKALGKCWTLVGKEAVEGPCPGTHPATVAALDAADAKARAALCKACGGADKDCGGGDDLAPVDIGVPAQCPFVTPAGAGSSCSAAIATVDDYADCVDCAADFAAGCAASAAVPHELAYPLDCNQLCEPGSQRACYSGPAGTENVGICTGGVETCEPDGQGYGACAGEVVPQREVCANGFDEDCTGVADNDPGDLDGDGYTLCEGGDCCELGESCGADPEDVNPGAFEVVANGVDDDCFAGDAVAPVTCSLGADYDATGIEMANAMEICESTTPDVAEWGILSAQLLRVDGAAIDARQAAVLQDYGPILPIAGATVAGISSSVMRDAGDPDFSTLHTFGSNGTAPAAYLTAHAGAVPPEAGCSAGNVAGEANDSVVLRLQVRAPSNARSFSYDFRFLSMEFPGPCTAFNDAYLALLTGTAPGLPLDANVSAQSNGIPFGAFNPLMEACGPTGCTDTVLTAEDGLMPWMTTTAPVVPGETITLELMVFDASDTTVGTYVLFDNFAWSTLDAPVATVPKVF